MYWQTGLTGNYRRRRFEPDRMVRCRRRTAPWRIRVAMRREDPQAGHKQRRAMIDKCQDGKLCHGSRHDGSARHRPWIRLRLRQIRCTQCRLCGDAVGSGRRRRGRCYEKQSARADCRQPNWRRVRAARSGATIYEVKWWPTGLCSGEVNRHPIHRQSDYRLTARPPKLIHTIYFEAIANSILRNVQVVSSRADWTTARRSRE